MKNNNWFQVKAIKIPDIFLQKPKDPKNIMSFNNQTIYLLHQIIWTQTIGWTNPSKLWVGAQDNMANAVSMPTECCPKNSEFMKRNWPGAARIQFIKGNHEFYNGAKPKIFLIDFFG